MSVDAMNLKYVLRQVQANSNDLHDDPPSLQFTSDIRPRREGGSIPLTPAVQEETLHFSERGRVQPCIRPLNAAAVAASPDLVRGSSPNQSLALFAHVALVAGLPNRRPRPFRINVVIILRFLKRTNATSYSPGGRLLLMLPQTKQIDRSYRCSTALRRYAPSCWQAQPPQPCRVAVPGAA